MILKIEETTLQTIKNQTVWKKYLEESIVPERKLENFFRFKEDTNFNRRNTWSILRIKI